MVKHTTQTDTTATVIIVVGDNPATIELRAIYTDAGATSGGGETVTTSGTVDTTAVGTYTITIQQPTLPIIQEPPHEQSM